MENAKLYIQLLCMIGVRDAGNDGEKVNMNWSEQVEEAVRRRMSANQPVWGLIDKVGKATDLSKSQKDSLLTELYGSLSDKDVTQKLVSQAPKYHIGTSFRSNMTALMRTKRRMRQLGVDILPGRNSKVKDREFAEALGIPVPETYARDVAFSDIALVPNSILKPMRGSSSRGVFYIDHRLRLHSVYSSKNYDSIEDAKAEIITHKASISIDKWLLEEVILGHDGKPANDLKVYAFYGQAGMFLEIDRSSDQTKTATYNSSGELIELGPGYEAFPGSGIPTPVWELTRTVSLAMPVPFMRLDFHYGNDGLYLGEITPHPGGTYAGQLFDSVDKMLGHHFEDAKARLLIDLLNGKTFPEFQAVYDVSYSGQLLGNISATSSRGLS